MLDKDKKMMYKKYPFLSQILHRQKSLPDGFRWPDFGKEILDKLQEDGFTLLPDGRITKETLEEPDEILEAEITKDLLVCCPHERVHDVLWEVVQKSTAYHLVLTDGTVIKNFVRPRKLFTVSQGRVISEQDGETIVDAVERQGITPEKIDYIVAERYWEYHTRDMVEPDRSLDVHIYRTPDAQELQDEIRKAREYIENLKKNSRSFSVTLEDGTTVEITPAQKWRPGDVEIVFDTLYFDSTGRPVTTEEYLENIDSFSGFTVHLKYPCWFGDDADNSWAYFVTATDDDLPVLKKLMQWRLAQSPEEAVKGAIKLFREAQGEVLGTDTPGTQQIRL